MPFGLGIQELLIIGGIALLIFGPSRLPKLGRSVGETIREFRNVGRQLDADRDEDEGK